MRSPHTALLLPLLLVCVAADAPSKDKATKEDATKWQSLFDGKELGHWKSTEFGGQGEVKVEDGQIVLGRGDSLTGVTWQGDVPAKIDYEIELDAQRVDGNDFFCGLTVPVNDTSVSLIVGGWGGGLCGISCLDFNDAANNETTKIIKFENKKWYHIRMRVLAERLKAWIDDDEIVDVGTKGKKLSVRHEVDASQPLGIASYQTIAAVKNIKLRKLTEEEIKAGDKASDAKS